MTPHPRRFHPPGRTAKPGPAPRSVPFRATPGGTSRPFPSRPPFAAPPVSAKPLRGSADTGNPLLDPQSCMDKMAARPAFHAAAVRLALPGSGIPRLFPHSRPYPPGTPAPPVDCPVRACAPPTLSAARGCRSMRISTAWKPSPSNGTGRLPSVLSASRTRRCAGHEGFPGGRGGKPSTPKRKKKTVL